MTEQRYKAFQGVLAEGQTITTSNQLSRQFAADGALPAGQGTTATTTDV